LQWLYDILEENKDKRCFVFQHMMRLDGCGNAHGLYGWDGLNNKHGKVFLSLMEHYKNVIWFHGHSHTPFKLQGVQPTPIANYDRLFGCHSVHIPSLAIPRYGNSDVIFDAEGYVVDVYENGIHLRGVDFIEEEFVPIASYWIDTTPLEIASGTYVDSSGVINTGGSVTEGFPEGSEIYLNQQYSQSGGGIIDRSGYYSIIMPAEPSRTYTLVISNVKNLNYQDTTFYALDSNKANAQTINNSKYVCYMDGLTFTNADKTSAELVFTTGPDTEYVVFVSTSASNISENLKGIGLSLIEKITIPKGSELLLNQRYSQSGGGLIDSSGNFVVIIPIDYPTNNNTLLFSNMPGNGLTVTGTTLYKLDENKISLGYVNNSPHPCNMNTGCVISDDGKSAVIDFIPGADTCYMAFTFTVKSNNIVITEDDVKDIKISLDIRDALIKEDITNKVVWTTDTRLSGTDGSYKTQTGCVASNDISVRQGDVIRVYGFEKRGLYPYIAAYRDGIFVNYTSLEVQSSNDVTTFTAQYDDTNNVLEIQIKLDTINSIRICNNCTNPSNLLVTRNMDITVPKEITEEITWQEDTRLSSSTGGYTELEGIAASSDIAVVPGDVVRIYGFISGTTACYVNEYRNGSFVRNNALSNAGMNPSETNNLIAEFDTETLVLTVKIKPNANNIDMIRVCGCCINVESMRVAMNKILYNVSSTEPIVLPNGAQIYLNQRYSGSGNALVDATTGMFAVKIPAKSNTQYTLKIENLPKSILDTTDNTVYLTDASLMQIGTVCGSNAIPNMNTGVEFINGGTTCTFNFNTLVGTAYIAVSIKVNNTNTTIFNISQLNGIKISLEEQDVQNDIILPEGSELVLNQRYSRSGGGLVSSDDNDKRMFTVFIPLDHTSTQRYKLSIKNSPIALTSASGSVIYSLDANKTEAYDVNGSTIPNMTNGITLYNNNKSADIEFVLQPYRKYIVISLLVTSQIAGYVITEEDLKGYEISIEKLSSIYTPSSDPCDLTDSITWQSDTRLSSNDGSYKTQTGAYASSNIPCTFGDVVTIYNLDNPASAEGYNYVIGYNENDVLTGFINCGSSTLATGYLDVVHVDDTTIKITILMSSIKYIRVCGKCISPSTVEVLLNM
jgi:hypothetical protein